MRVRLVKSLRRPEFGKKFDEIYEIGQGAMGIVGMACCGIKSDSICKILRVSMLVDSGFICIGIQINEIPSTTNKLN